MYLCLAAEKRVEQKTTEQAAEEPPLAAEKEPTAEKSAIAEEEYLEVVFARFVYLRCTNALSLLVLE